MNYYMEHCYGDYEKMSLIQKLCSDNLYDNLKPEGHPFRPVKKLAVKLASYFMQMSFRVSDLNF